MTQGLGFQLNIERTLKVAFDAIEELVIAQNLLAAAVQEIRFSRGGPIAAGPFGSGGGGIPSPNNQLLNYTRLGNIATIIGTEPQLRFEETDQTDPVGRFRIRVAGDLMRFESSDAANWGGAKTGFLNFWGTRSLSEPSYLTSTILFLNPTAGTASSGNNLVIWGITAKATGSTETAALKATTAEISLVATNTQDWTGSGATDISSLPFRVYQASLVSQTGAAGTITAAALYTTSGVIRDGTYTVIDGMLLTNIATSGGGSIGTQAGIRVKAITSGTIRYGIIIEDQGSNAAIHVAGGGVNFVQADGASAVQIGTAINVGGWLTSAGAGQLGLSGGAQFNNTAWVARAVSASIIDVSTGIIDFFTNTGLTPGNTFTPIRRIRIDGNTLMGPSGGNWAIHPNLATSDATERTLTIQVLDATANAFLDMITFTPAAAAPTMDFKDRPISNVNIKGVKFGQVTKTGDYTLTADDVTVFADSSGGAITITLPAVSGLAGTFYHIKKVDTSGNSVTLDANGSETIDKQLTQVITASYTSITVQTDGTEWWII